MPEVALKALRVAYRNQAEWLLAQAEQFESGARKVTGQMRGKELDITSNIAAEYRHKARNLIAVMEIYERLHSAGTTQPVGSGRSLASLRNLFRKYRTVRPLRWLQTRLEPPKGHDGSVG